MHRTHGVPWRGPVDAPLYIIGEAPGNTEMREGKPFVGESGRMLARIVRGAGLDPDGVRWGNVYPVRPPTPGGKFPARGKKREAMLAEAVEWVREQWGRGNPRMLVLVGDVALGAMTSCRGVLQYAGAFLGHEWTGSATYGVPKPLHVGSIVHPASLLRDKSRRLYPWLLVHLTRYCEIALGGAPDFPLFNLCTNIAPASLRSATTLVLDTEYNPETRVPHLIGLTDGEAEGGPIASFVLPHFKRTVLELLSNAKTLVMHNAPADLQALATLGFTLRSNQNVHDTMLTASLLQPDLPVSLSACTRYETYCRPWKGMRGTAEEVEYNALDVEYTRRVYAAQCKELKQKPSMRYLRHRQTEVLLRIMDMVREGMRVDRELLERLRWAHTRAARRYERYARKAVEDEVRAAASPDEAQAALARIEQSIDELREKACKERTCKCKSRLKVKPRKCEECKRVYASMMPEIHKLRQHRDVFRRLLKKKETYAHEFSITNPYHLRWLVYEAWGVKKGRRRTASGLARVDMEVLDELSHQLEGKRARVLRACVKARQLRKALSTFLAPELDENDHTHPSFKLHGTATGRPSSGAERQADVDDPNDRGAVFNAFNIPKAYRRLIVPRPGYVFVGGDYSDIEGRMVALDSGARELCRWYVEGKDVHSVRADLAYGCGQTKAQAKAMIVAHKGKYPRSARDAGKQLGHASHYGARVEMAAKVLGLSVKEAARAQKAMFAPTPEIRRWQTRTVERVWGVKRTRQDGTKVWVTTPTHRLKTEFGRVRYYWGREDQKNEALAQRPQSHAIDVWFGLLMRITQHRSSKLVEPWDGRVVTGTYDSILCEVREWQAEAFEEWLKEMAEVEVTELEQLPGAQYMAPRFPFETGVARHYGEL